MNREYDFLVIGSGLAGLAFALKASEVGRVCVLSKGSLTSANTPMAQGGIAAVMSSTDSFEQHIEDTLEAGAGLCHPEVVRAIVEQGPERIDDLIKWGVQFDVQEPTQGQRPTSSPQTKVLSLTREGGHRSRRILHIGDHTGLEIHAQLLKQALKNPKIEFVENQLAVDLIINKQLQPFDISPWRCLGAYVLDKSTEQVWTCLAKVTVLATGGAGKVYRYTSNWSGASGDGIAMAYRAGARISNMEFMQFHPTCLYHPQNRTFLISEALRGEGAQLLNSEGEDFMQAYHPSGSLAPRDIVARSIDAEMKRSGADCVYLDATKLNRDFLQQRFPVIYARCLELGIDISSQPIPVVPAAHYLCGGVITDLKGQTDVVNLLALGETACTGLHGANRLASNSLLECLVLPHNAVMTLKENWALMEKEAELHKRPSPQPWPLHDKENADELMVVSHMWDEIRRLMWDYVGISRSNRRLERAQHRLANIRSEIKHYYANFKTHSDVVELRNIATVAELTVRCALLRRGSVGIHFNIDEPAPAQNLTDISYRDTVINPGLLGD